MSSPYEVATADYERENHEAMMNRERYEESQFDEDVPKPKNIPINPEDKEATILALKMAIADAKDYMTIEDLAFNIVVGIYEWPGSQIEKLEALSKALIDHIGKPITN